MILKNLVGHILDKISLTNYWLYFIYSHHKVQ